MIKMKLSEIIHIDESNLSNATKYEYNFRLRQFYKYAPIKSDEELINTLTKQINDNTYYEYNITRTKKTN